jgi:hypothetical protein
MRWSGYAARIEVHSGFRLGNLKKKKKKKKRRQLGVPIIIWEDKTIFFFSIGGV